MINTHPSASICYFKGFSYLGSSHSANTHFMKTASLKKQYLTVIDSLNLNETEKNLVKIIWLDYFLLLDKHARQGIYSSNTSQIIIIFFSLIIPVIETIPKIPRFPFGLSIISLLSIIIALITALNRQMNFDARWKHYRKNAEMMRNEGDDFLALSGSYQKFKTHSDGFQYFTTAITLFRRQEINQYFDSEKEKVGQKANAKNAE